jgi:CheY-like chemotaxis protein
MTEQTDLRKLLILKGPSTEAEGIVSLLSEHFEVRLVDTIDSALETMRRERFHAVLAEVADFLPLERGVVTQQASVVLDTIGDGVAIVGPGGELVWANRRLRGAPEGVIDSLCKLCVDAYEQFACGPARATGRGKRFSLMPNDGSYYEVICSPVRDRDGILRQVAAVVVNATSQRRQQLKLNAIDRAGRELVRLDYDALSNRDARQRLQHLEERIIRCSRDVLDYEHFAVLLVDEKTNRLQLVISDHETEQPEKYDMFASSEGSGICGYVAATGRSYICRDIERDPRYISGLDGARSSLTVPLRLQDKVIGVMNAESRVPDAFGEEDRQFAEIFATHVALALHILNLLVFERHSTHTQVSGSICAEMAGPLNDIISEASEIMEDYIGHDDLRKRLSGLIDAANDARRRIQEFSEGSRTGIVRGGEADSQRDPVLADRRVLVADDEELIGETIRDVLTPMGCEVDIAFDGVSAVEQIRQNSYDLVISDIKMPGATGYDVFSAAKEKNPDTAVILITAFGYDPNHSIVRCRTEGLAAVVMKPFKVRQLLQECRTALTSS